MVQKLSPNAGLFRKTTIGGGRIESFRFLESGEVKIAVKNRNEKRL
jgi:hypothetical protein